jgi:LacI family transcriptional regulator
MRMCLLELAKLGCVRPAALVDEATHERAKRAWEGAFLACHPEAENARALWALQRKGGKTDFAAWLRAAHADALIVSTTELLSVAGVRAAVREAGLPIVSLHWQDETRGIGGVDQCYERVAAHAVDLVIAQLNLNELGPPDLPRIMLFTGYWVPPAMAKSAAARSVATRATAELKSM